MINVILSFIIVVISVVLWIVCVIGLSSLVCGIWIIIYVFNLGINDVVMNCVLLLFL